MPWVAKLLDHYRKSLLIFQASKVKSKFTNSVVVFLDKFACDICFYSLELQRNLRSLWKVSLFINGYICEPNSLFFQDQGQKKAHLRDKFPRVQGYRRNLLFDNLIGLSQSESHAKFVKKRYFRVAHKLLQKVSPLLSSFKIN